MNDRWSAALTAITRWNSYKVRFSSDDFQMGGALLFTHKRRPGLQYKFGMYYNSEFSGPFFMPLLGIDWQIDDRNNIFGVLPGNMTYEHKVSRHFYYGATFRAITNSYRTENRNVANMPGYIRVQDNQLGAFADWYLSKNIVLNVEAAHSVFRRFLLGYKDANPRYYFQDNVQDNFVFKMSLAYRVRFR